MDNYNIVMIDNSNIDELQNLMRDQRYNILYGAGSTGKECLELLHRNNIRVDYFCDDDKTKWGKCIKDIEVISPSKLEIIKKGINLIITSIYAKRIYLKLKNIIDINIYELFSIYGANKGLVQQIPGLTNEQVQDYQSKAHKVTSFLCDDESKKTLSRISEAITSKITEVSFIRDIVSDEECYFIKEVNDSLSNYCNIIDAGAYTGEILRSLNDLKLEYNKIFFFEVEDSNFKILEHNTRDLDGTYCSNKGLWNYEGVVYIEKDDAATRIVDYKTKDFVQVTTIDQYFKNEQIDFIKMDIEGSETNALAGGMETIQRDRPILAISIYHSIMDLVDIPILLYDNLKDYMFFIRHHSMIFAETVLYGIPIEKYRINKKFE